MGGHQQPARPHQASILLATVHVRASERDSLQLAHAAITSVTKLSSVRARRQLTPLVVALEAQPGNDAEQLARMTRQVIATRA